MLRHQRRPPTPDIDNDIFEMCFSASPVLHSNFVNSMGHQLIKNDRVVYKNQNWDPWDDKFVDAKINAGNIW